MTGSTPSNEPSRFLAKNDWPSNEMYLEYAFQGDLPRTGGRLHGT